MTSLPDTDLFSGVGPERSPTVKVRPGMDQNPARPVGLTRDQPEIEPDRVSQLYKCGVEAGSYGRESREARAPVNVGLNDPRPPQYRISCIEK